MRRLLLTSILLVFLTSCREMVEKEADEQLAIAEQALHEGNWKEADKAFHEAILLDPDRTEAWVGRGMALTRLDGTDEARFHYQEALLIYDKRLRDDPLDLHLIRRKIMLLVLLDRQDEALELARETAENHPHPAAEELPALVGRLTQEFDEMILPPAKVSREDYPYPYADEAP